MNKKKIALFSALVIILFNACNKNKIQLMTGQQNTDTPIYVFGYGSLINPKSVNKTLKRDIIISDLIPCFLTNFVRSWNVKDSIMSEELNQPIEGVFLNITESLQSEMNGVIFKVTNDEFEQMKLREKNYNYIDISDKIKIYSSQNDNSKLNGVVYTFIAKPNYIANKLDTNCYVMQNYIGIIEDGLSYYDDAFKKRFEATTAKIEFPILKGKYTFLDLGQRNALENNKKK
jgi:cation transport regulator ChaC